MISFALFFKIVFAPNQTPRLGTQMSMREATRKGRPGRQFSPGDSWSQEPHLLPSPLTILPIQIQRLPNSSAQRTTTLHAASLPISWPTCMHALLADLHGIRLGDSWPTLHSAHHSNVRGETADPGDSNRNPGKRTEKTSSFLVSCHNKTSSPIYRYGMWPPLQKNLWHRCSIHFLRAWLRRQAAACAIDALRAPGRHGGISGSIALRAGMKASRCDKNTRTCSQNPRNQNPSKSTALAEKGLL
jgi:hypothetical protein